LGSFGLLQKKGMNIGVTLVRNGMKSNEREEKQMIFLLKIDKKFG
jgi:hypothetical protein